MWFFIVLGGISLLIALICVFITEDSFGYESGPKWAWLVIPTIIASFCFLISNVIHKNTNVSSFTTTRPVKKVVRLTNKVIVIDNSDFEKTYTDIETFTKVSDSSYYVFTHDVERDGDTCWNWNGVLKHKVND